VRTVLQTFQVAQPTAGADWSFVPSNSDRVKLLFLMATLTTAATVANRYPALAFKDQGGNIYYGADAGVPQAASLAVHYCWSRSGSTAVATAIFANERVGLALPDAWVEPGDAVESLTAAIAAADQWTNIFWRGIVGDQWEDEQHLAEIAAALSGGGRG
jgi:hypothetical protein